MKWRFTYKIIFLLLITFIHIIGYSNSSNTNTKEYCQSLIDSANREYSQKNYARCIEMLTEAKTLAETNNWVNLRIKTLNSLGVAYQLIFDHEKAMEYYLEAYKLVLQASNEKQMEVIILNNIAGLYTENKKYEKATEYYQKVLDIAKQIKDTVGIALSYINLSIIANDIGNLESAAKYLDLSSALFKSISMKDNDIIIVSQIIKAENLYKRKDYLAAEKLLLDILKEHNDQLSETRRAISLFVLMSKIYQQLDNYEKAVYFARKALDYSPTLEERITIYDQLSAVYWGNNSYAFAWKYKDSVIVLKDSLYKADARDNLGINHIRFELLNSEKALVETKARQKAERTLFIFILIFTAIGIVILIWIFRIQSIRNKQRKQITELELEKEKNQKLLLEQYFKEKETLTLLKEEQLNNEKLRLEQQLKEQETSALLEQERINNEKLMLAQQLKEQELEQVKLNGENKQLAAKVLIQSNRNGLIEEIIQRLSKIPVQSEDSQLQHVIRQLKTQLRESTEWDNSMTYFKQVNPSFLSGLKSKHPNLSVSDIRFLSYLFLNFNTREIADLLNMSLDACKKKRQRLADKIGVKTSELYTYLLSINS